jgi:biotin carboxyl carrier protein
MLKATVNNKKEFTIDKNTIDGKPVVWDMIEVRENTFHIISGNKSYNATLLSFNPEEKTMVVKVNGNEYQVSIKDKYDLLLQQLGIQNKVSSTVQHIKAPMPGLIINIAANEGDEVKKDDVLIILEAMKMENAIKSPRNGRIKQVHIQLRQAVEKNQVLLEFE